MLGALQTLPSLQQSQHSDLGDLDNGNLGTEYQREGALLLLDRQSISITAHLIRVQLFQ